MKTFVTSSLVFLCCMSLCMSGCSQSRQQMKIPEIKMITPENVHGIMAPDDDHIWLTGNYGIIFHSSDGGETWVPQDSGIRTGILVDGVFINNTIGWVCGMNGVILNTTDGGATWNRQNTGTERHLFSISFVDANHGWAIGEWSTIIHTTDGGATWKPQAEEADKIYSNVFFTDTENGWIVGEAGIILHTADGGATWNRQMPKDFERDTYQAEFEDPRPALFCVYFTDKNNGWACGIEGTILKTEDGGVTWDVLPSGTGNALYTIYILGNRGWAVGDKGTYCRSDDGGKTWDVHEDAITSKMWFRDVFFSSPQKGWVAGMGGTVVGTTDGGTTWSFYSGLSYDMEFIEMPEALEFKGMVYE